MVDWRQIEPLAKRANVDPYIIYETLESIEQGVSFSLAFAEACENQNLYGDYQEAIEHRVRAAEHLDHVHGVSISRYDAVNIDDVLFHERKN
tara:strand:+ start:382 stop:657 length:276 start_codon:yes stop_codon:yes gene_type:complete